LEKYDYLDGMFNYEAMIIKANQTLTKQGRQPLYAIYLTDGQAIADSTLGFVNQGEGREAAKQVYLDLKEYLLQPKVQKKIFNVGFRAGLIGMNPDQVNKSVYNPEWGIDLKRTISPIVWPQAEVIEEALRAYQTAFRKPSFTVYLLDISGSMKGRGLSSLKKAMGGLLDQSAASRYFLQTGENDISVIIPFNASPLKPLTIKGNDQAALQEAIKRINGLNAGGGTNIYLPVIQALRIFEDMGDRITDYLPAVILMTDGRSKSGNLADVRRAWRAVEGNFDLPPVFGVTFGQADEAQLKELAEYTVARVFDGRKGLEKAFRKAKGYN
jgi:Ca-activated chloride channel family protein